MILGALFVLGGLSGAVLAVERHMALSESLKIVGLHIDDAEAAEAAKNPVAFEQSIESATWMLSHAARQTGERNLYAATGGGALWLGAVFLVLGFRPKAARPTPSSAFARVPAGAPGAGHPHAV